MTRSPHVNRRSRLPHGIERRLIFALGATLLCILALTAYGVYASTAVDSASKKLSRADSAVASAQRLDIDILRIVVALQYYVQTRDEEYARAIIINRNASDGERVTLRSLTDNANTEKALDSFEAILPTRVRIADQIVVLTRTNPSSSQLPGLLVQRRNLDNEARGYLRAIISDEENSSASIAAALKDETANTRIRLIILSLATTLILVLSGYFLYRSITRPLGRLTQMARDIEHGDLSSKNAVNSRDELGLLGRTMNDMARSLSRVDAMKRSFIAIASHQLRAPATVVKQNLGLIVEGLAANEEDKIRFTRAAYDANEEQLAIINDILGVARVEAGTLSPVLAPTDLNELAERVVREQTPLVKAGQTIVFTPDRTLEKVSADPNHIKMCLDNLVGNAVKYTPESGTITVTTKSQGTDAELRVTDTGVGIAHDDIGKLFVKFSRIENPLSAKVGGTGLGLYLVKELVVQHGGSVKVESEVGRGTSFIIRLPKRKP